MLSSPESRLSNRREIMRKSPGRSLSLAGGGVKNCLLKKPLWRSARETLGSL